MACRTRNIHKRSCSASFWSYTVRNSPHRWPYFSFSLHLWLEFFSFTLFFFFGGEFQPSHAWKSACFGLLCSSPPCFAALERLSREHQVMKVTFSQLWLSSPLGQSYIAPLPQESLKEILSLNLSFFSLFSARLRQSFPPSTPQ